MTSRVLTERTPSPGEEGRAEYIRALVAQAQAGDRRARNQICREYERLVIQRARRIAFLDAKSPGMGISSASVDDYTQGGYLGLMRAVDLWDEKKSAATGCESFTSYAIWWIDQASRRLGECMLVHVPLNYRCKTSVSLAYLDAPVKAGDEESAPLLDLMPSARNQEDEVASLERDVLVRAAIENMRVPKRTRDILARRLIDEAQLHEIGEEHGVTRERVRQIVERHLPTVLSSVKYALAHPSKRRDALIARQRRMAEREERTRTSECMVVVEQRGEIAKVCGRHAVARGMCKRHYALWRAGAHAEDLKREIQARGGPRSERARTAKLGWEQVREIRRRHAADGTARLAREFGVAKNSILRIVRGETWRESRAGATRAA